MLSEKLRDKVMRESLGGRKDLDCVARDFFHLRWKGGRGIHSGREIREGRVLGVGVRTCWCVENVVQRRERGMQGNRIAELKSKIGRSECRARRMEDGGKKDV